ncbi:Crossover junction endodeoxyribonuclease RuvC [hydrothermal vent metagenome]|uniref:Crossover junction endodeoxyribonuclease RuvC n=1 Tax=hydrothermal vent metagenome TaxID=652676 RepID=A0A3B0WZY9_9ZZZZ
MTIRILGIDPGSRQTGYGIIDAEKNRSSHVDSGCIYVKGETFPDRLGDIFTQISHIIVEYSPVELSIEQVFVSKNVASAMKLAQARSAAICAAVNAGLKVSEYAPKTIKSAVVGTGSASKEQVQHMMSMLLKLEKGLQADQADALAIALCHAHHRELAEKLSLPVRRRAAGRWTSLPK